MARLGGSQQQFAALLSRGAVQGAGGQIHQSRRIGPASSRLTRPGCRPSSRQATSPAAQEPPYYDFDKLYFDNFQGLPTLPIPKLDDTLDRYLKSLRCCRPPRALRELKHPPARRGERTAVALTVRVVEQAAHRARRAGCAHQECRGVPAK